MFFPSTVGKWVHLKELILDSITSSITTFICLKIKTAFPIKLVVLLCRFPSVLLLPEGDEHVGNLFFFFSIPSTICHHQKVCRLLVQRIFCFLSQKVFLFGFNGENKHVGSDFFPISFSFLPPSATSRKSESFSSVCSGRTATSSALRSTSADFLPGLDMKCSAEDFRRCFPTVCFR